MTKVLFIEDDPGILMLGQRALETMGHKVTTAETAQEALKCFKADTFDLVITDLRIPGQNGLSTVGEMRKIKSDQSIIVTSGSDMETEEFRKELKKIGGAQILAKPFELDRFLELVKKTLNGGG